MTTAFYMIFIIVGTYIEILVLSSYNEYQTMKSNIKLYSKDKEIKLSRSEYTLLLFGSTYGILALVGLFSSQWKLFLCMFILSIINLIVEENTIENIYKWYRQIDAVISIGIMLAIVINKFHI